MFAQKNLRIVIPIALVAVVGLLSLAFIAASPNHIAFEAETSSVSGAEIVSDPAASKGQFIQFDSQNTPIISPYGFILPEVGVSVGHPGAPSLSNLTPIGPANIGTQGLIIDQNYLNANQGKPWLTQESGRPVIDGIIADNLCLSIKVTLTLRNSYINCATRHQPDNFGTRTYDTGVIHVESVSDVIIENNTITCSSFDDEICSRTIRDYGTRTIMQYNDMSFTRGSVRIGENSVMRYNYMHDYAFGQQADQTDGVTHNNGVEGEGVPNGLIEGNYFDLRFGRLSRDAATNASKGVSIGSKIRGFSVNNYLWNGSGNGFTVRRNFFAHSPGGLIGCDKRNRPAPVCAQEFSYNFLGGYNTSGTGALWQWNGSAAGVVGASCNYSIDSSDDTTPVLLHPNAFQPESHTVAGCSPTTD